MPTIIHNGVRLAYEDIGKGARSFFFVHGWTCDRSFFTPQVEHFAKRYRTISIDLRGHGDSDKPAGDYPITAYAEDAAYMIRRLGLGKTIAVGHSMGGCVVLQLAATYADCVAAIVMIDPSTFERTPAIYANVEKLLAAIEAGDQKFQREFIEKQRFLPTSDRKLMERVLSVMMAGPSHVAASAMRGALAFNGPAVALQCRVPALHVAATPPANPPHLMSQWLPNVVNGLTVGAGHFNQLEAPDQVNSMIDGFVRHYVPLA